MARSTTSDSGTSKRAHRAGIFDIRVFIGALLGVYGVILTLTGLFATNDDELAKTDDFNINLVAGIVMIVAGAAFIAWARLRPVVVPPHAGDAQH
jgi:drug/metabolite transporter (DMT)-like permease